MAFETTDPHAGNRAAAEGDDPPGMAVGDPPGAAVGEGGDAGVRRGEVARAAAGDDDRSRVTFPGARAPDRDRVVASHGVRLAVHEWGDEGAPPLLLAHGGFDFGRTYDVFAPLLAAAGWRVVVWDQRGHGDSAHAHLYSWDADLRDAVAVLDTLGDPRARGRAGGGQRGPGPGAGRRDRETPRPVPVVGHSKGGGVMVQLANALPQRVSRVVNIDGMPSARPVPDVPDHQRTKMVAGEMAGWLDYRRGLVDAMRKPGTIDELAARRGRMNPRLTPEWLRYLVVTGARRDPDGWRWKLDPTIRPGGFGPWRPEWSMARLPGLSMPLLAILGTIPERMGWGTQPGDVLPNLPPGGHLEVMADTGHFVHIEQPHRVADLVLDFLGEPS